MTSSSSLASVASMASVPSLPRIIATSQSSTTTSTSNLYQRSKWADQHQQSLSLPTISAAQSVPIPVSRTSTSTSASTVLNPSRTTGTHHVANLRQQSTTTLTDHINELQSRIHNLTPQLDLYRSLLSSLAQTLSPHSHHNHDALSRICLVALIHIAAASLNLKGTLSALAHESGIHLSTFTANRSALASLLLARAFPAATSLTQSIVPKDMLAPMIGWLQYVHVLHIYGRSPTTSPGNGCGRQACLDWIDRHVKSARVRNLLREELDGIDAPPSGTDRECTTACQLMWSAVSRLICGDHLGQLDPFTMDAAPVIARYFGDPLTVLANELRQDQCDLWPLALMRAKRAKDGLEEAGFSAPAPPPAQPITSQKPRHRSRSRRRRSRTPSRQRTWTSDESAATPKAARNSPTRPPVPPIPEAYRVPEQQQDAQPRRPNERKDSAIAMESVQPPPPPLAPPNADVRQFTSQPITCTIATAPTRPPIPRTLASSSSFPSSSPTHPVPAASQPKPNLFNPAPAPAQSSAHRQPLPPSLMPRRPPGSAARPPVAASRLIRRSGMRNLVVCTSTSTDSLPNAPTSAPAPPPIVPPSQPPPLMPPPLEFESAAMPPPEWNALGTSTNGTMDVTVDQVVGVFPGSIRLLDVADHDGQSLICFTTATPDSSSPAQPDRRVHILLNFTPHARLSLPTYHHKSLLTYLRFLGPTRPQSDWLVAADSESDIHLWHWPSGQRTTWRKWHKRVVYQVAGFPGRAEGGKAVLVSCAADHAVKVWGVASVPGETAIIAKAQGPGGGDAGANKSARRKSIGGGNAIGSPAAELVASVHSNAPFYAFCFAGSTTETQVLIAAQAYTLRVYKARTLALMHTFHLDHHKLNKLCVGSLLTLLPLASTDDAHPPVPNASSTSTPDALPTPALTLASAAPESLTSILVVAANGTHVRLFHPSLNAFSRAFAARELDAAASPVAGHTSSTSSTSSTANTCGIRYPVVSPCGSLVAAPGATGLADRRIVVWRAASGRAVNLVARPAKGKELGVFADTGQSIREVGVGPVAWEKGGEGRIVGVIVGVGEEGAGAATGAKAVKSAVCVWRVGK